MWEMIPKELDETDMNIFHALRKNGRISMTELGKEVFMTSQAVKNRIARLQDLGVVERYTVNVNCPLFGYTIHCVFELVTDEKTREGFLEFMKHTEYHIFHCYRVDGAYRFFLDAHFHSEKSRADFIREVSAFGRLTTHQVMEEIQGLHPVDE